MKKDANVWIRADGNRWAWVVDVMPRGYAVIIHNCKGSADSFEEAQRQSELALLGFGVWTEKKKPTTIQSPFSLAVVWSFGVVWTEKKKPTPDK